MGCWPKQQIDLRELPLVVGLKGGYQNVAQLALPLMGFCRDLGPMQAAQRHELEVTADAIEHARRDATRLAAPYRDDIVRLAAEEAALRDSIAGDPQARALFELTEERRHIAEEESAALGRAIEETELRLLATRERAIVDDSALAAFAPATQPRIKLYNEWRRAQLARSVREREGRIERERAELRARVQAEAELILATSQDRMEVEALEVRRDEYTAQAAAMRAEIAAAEATALATGRLIRGTVRELHQLRVAVQFETSERAAQRDALGAVHQRVADAKQQLDSVLAEEAGRVEAELEAEFAPQLAVAQRGECSFMYRYIVRESCSQFDSLPLTSLTISPRRRGGGDAARRGARGGVPRKGAEHGDGSLRRGLRTAAARRDADAARGGGGRQDRGD